MYFRRLLVLIFLATSCVLLTGCSSSRFPVKGKVHYADGSPVEAGSVIAEATIDGKLVGIQGNIEKDGTFKMGGDQPGDGALPGSYRVIVMPVSLGDSELAAGKTPAVDGKFSRFDSSGITFEVKDKEVDVDIPVTKPKSKQ